MGAERGGEGGDCVRGRQCMLSVYFFKVTEPSLLQDSFSVRQKGGLLGPPARSPRPRIHRCPGGLYRWAILDTGSSTLCQ